jgi:hypothetical protein
VVECDGLENRYTRKGIEGSNPSFSANPHAFGFEWQATFGLTHEAES